MKEQELHNMVSEKLRKFGTLEDIQPSPDWNRSLTDRLDSGKFYYVSAFSAVKIAFIVLLVVLFNIGFILKSVNNDSNKSYQRLTDLQTISKALLINPYSANN